MDKRLFKSLTTAKARYENTIADAQAKLHVVNSMLESLGKTDLPPKPESDTPPATPEPVKEQVPTFLKGARESSPGAV